MTAVTLAIPTQRNVAPRYCGGRPGQGAAGGGAALGTFGLCGQMNVTASTMKIGSGWKIRGQEEDLGAGEHEEVMAWVGSVGEGDGQ